MPLPKPLFLRALAITLGSMIAVIPVLFMRILLVIAAEGMQLETGVWTRLFYLPYELIFPFLLSSMMLRRQPDIASTSLSIKTLLYSVASSPFFAAVFTLLVSLDASANRDFTTTLATLVGLTPFLGALGLVGLLLLFFPLTLFGGVVACAADYFICRSYRREIQTLRFEHQFRSQSLTFKQRLSLIWKSWKAKLKPKTSSLEHYTDVLLKAEFERYREPLLNQLTDIDELIADQEKNPANRMKTKVWREMLTQMRRQLLHVEKKTLSFHELLKQRLHVEEFTFFRYSGSVKTVYYAVLEHLDRAAKNLSLEISTQGAFVSEKEQAEHLRENEHAIRSIDEILRAIKTLPQQSKHQSPSLDEAIAEVEEMIERVGEYRK